MAVPGTGSYLFAFTIKIVAERRLAADPRLPSLGFVISNIRAFSAFVLTKIPCQNVFFVLLKKGDQGQRAGFGALPNTIGQEQS
jgi:hypothetical protein